MRPISHFLHGLQVVIVNRAAINKTIFKIVDCLQFKVFEVQKVVRDIVFSTSSFLIFSLILGSSTQHVSLKNTHLSTFYMQWSLSPGEIFVENAITVHIFYKRKVYKKMRLRLSKS